MIFLKISMTFFKGGGGGGGYFAINGITTGSWRIFRIIIQMLFPKFYVIEQNQPITINDFEEFLLPVTHSKLGQHQRSGFRFP